MPQTRHLPRESCFFRIRDSHSGCSCYQIAYTLTFICIALSSPCPSLSTLRRQISLLTSYAVLSYLILSCQSLPMPYFARRFRYYHHPLPCLSKR
jgi:hypothetical protein